MLANNVRLNQNAGFWLRFKAAVTRTIGLVVIPVYIVAAAVKIANTAWNALSNSRIWQLSKSIFTTWLLAFQGQQNNSARSTLPMPSSTPVPLNQVYEFECSANADLFFRARAYGTLSSLAQNGCQPLNEAFAQLSPTGVLYGVKEFQEIKTEKGKNRDYQSTLTQVRFTDYGNEHTTSQVKSDDKQRMRELIPDKNPDPKATYVYAGVKGENGEFCRGGFKNKCGN